MKWLLFTFISVITCGVLAGQPEKIHTGKEFDVAERVHKGKIYFQVRNKTNSYLKCKKVFVINKRPLEKFFAVSPKGKSIWIHHKPNMLFGCKKS